MAFIVRKFLENWALIYLNRNKIKRHYLFEAWSLLIFVGAIQHWFAIFDYHGNSQVNNIIDFFYFLIPLLLFYIMSIVLFPSFMFYEAKNPNGMGIHALKVRNEFYIIVILYLLYTTINDYFGIGDDFSFENIIVRIIVVITIFIGLFYSRFLPKKKFVHYLVFFLSCLGMCYFVFFRNENLIF